MTEIELLRQIMELDQCNARLSSWCQERNPRDELSDLMEECSELMIEWEDADQDSDTIPDELGDVIGSFMSVIRQAGTKMLARAVKMQINKYKRRKPWIFPDSPIPMPETPTEEYAYWFRMKKLERYGFADVYILPSDKAIRFIHKYFHDLILNQDYGTLAQVLNFIDMDRLSNTEALGVLQATFSVRERSDLPWTQLRQQVRDRLETRFSSLQVDQMMANLYVGDGWSRK